MKRKEVGRDSPHWNGHVAVRLSFWREVDESTPEPLPVVPRHSMVVAAVKRWCNL